MYYASSAEEPSQRVAGGTPGPVQRQFQMLNEQSFPLMKPESAQQHFNQESFIQIQQTPMYIEVPSFTPTPTPTPEISNIQYLKGIVNEFTDKYDQNQLKKVLGFLSELLLSNHASFLEIPRLKVNSVTLISKAKYLQAFALSLYKLVIQPQQDSVLGEIQGLLKVNLQYFPNTDPSILSNCLQQLQMLKTIKNRVLLDNATSNLIRSLKDLQQLMQNQINCLMQMFRTSQCQVSMITAQPILPPPVNPTIPSPVNPTSPTPTFSDDQRLAMLLSNYQILKNKVQIIEKVIQKLLQQYQQVQKAKQISLHWYKNIIWIYFCFVVQSGLMLELQIQSCLSYIAPDHQRRQFLALHAKLKKKLSPMLRIIIQVNIILVTNYTKVDIKNVLTQCINVQINNLSAQDILKLKSTFQTFFQWSKKGYHNLTHDLRIAFKTSQDQGKAIMDALIQNNIKIVDMNNLLDAISDNFQNNNKTVQEIKLDTFYIKQLLTKIQGLGGQKIQDLRNELVEKLDNIQVQRKQVISAMRIVAENSRYIPNLQGYILQSMEANKITAEQLKSHIEKYSSNTLTGQILQRAMKTGADLKELQQIARQIRSKVNQFEIILKQISDQGARQNQQVQNRLKNLQQMLTQNSADGASSFRSLQVNLQQKYQNDRRRFTKLMQILSNSRTQIFQYLKNNSNSIQHLTLVIEEAIRTSSNDIIQQSNQRNALVLKGIQDTKNLLFQNGNVNYEKMRQMLSFINGKLSDTSFQNEQFRQYSRGMFGTILSLLENNHSNDNTKIIAEVINNSQKLSKFMVQENIALVKEQTKLLLNKNEMLAESIITNQGFLFKNLSTDMQQTNNELKSMMALYNQNNVNWFNSLAQSGVSWNKYTLENMMKGFTRISNDMASYSSALNYTVINAANQIQQVVGNSASTLTNNLMNAAANTHNMLNQANLQNQQAFSNIGAHLSKQNEGLLQQLLKMQSELNKSIVTQTQNALVKATLNDQIKKISLKYGQVVPNTQSLDMHGLVDYYKKLIAFHEQRNNQKAFNAQQQQAILKQLMKMCDVKVEQNSVNPQLPLLIKIQQKINEAATQKKNIDSQMLEQKKLIDELMQQNINIKAVNQQTKKKTNQFHQVDKQLSVMQAIQKQNQRKIQQLSDVLLKTKQQLIQNQARQKETILKITQQKQKFIESKAQVQEKYKNLQKDYIIKIQQLTKQKSHKQKQLSGMQKIILSNATRLKEMQVKYNKLVQQSTKSLATISGQERVQWNQKREKQRIIKELQQQLKQLSTELSFHKGKEQGASMSKSDKQQERLKLIAQRDNWELQNRKMKRLKDLQIQNINEAKQDLEKQLKKAKNQQDDLQRQQKRYTQNIADLNSQIKILTKQIDYMKEIAQEEEKKLKQSENAIKKYRQESQNQRLKLVEYRDYDEIKKSLMTLTQKMFQTQKTHISVVHNLKAAQAELSTAKTNLKAKIIDFENLQKQMMSKVEKSDYERAQKELQVKKQQISKFQLKIIQLNAFVSSVTSEKAKVQQQLASEKAKKLKLQQRINVLELEVNKQAEEQKKSKERHQSQIKTQQASQTLLKSQLKNVEQQFESHKQRSQGQIKKIKEQMKQKNDEIKEKTENIKELKENIEVMQGQVNQSTSKLDQLSKITSKKIQELQSQLRIRNEVSQKDKNKIAQTQKLIKQLQNLQSISSDKIKEIELLKLNLELDLNELKKQLEIKETQRKKLEEIISEKDKKVEQKQAELMKMSNKIKDLQQSYIEIGRYNALNQKLEAQIKANKELTQRLSQKQKQFSQMLDSQMLDSSFNESTVYASFDEADLEKLTTQRNLSLEQIQKLKEQLKASNNKLNILRNITKLSHNTVVSYSEAVKTLLEEHFPNEDHIFMQLQKNWDNPNFYQIQLGITNRQAKKIKKLIEILKSRQVLVRQAQMINTKIKNQQADKSISQDDDDDLDKTRRRDQQENIKVARKIARQSAKQLDKKEQIVDGYKAINEALPNFKKKVLTPIVPVQSEMYVPTAVGGTVKYAQKIDKLTQLASKQAEVIIFLLVAFKQLIAHLKSTAKDLKDALEAQKNNSRTTIKIVNSLIGVVNEMQDDIVDLLKNGVVMSLSQVAKHHQNVANVIAMIKQIT